MKLLVLGGTVFLGRHIVDFARSRGHDVTLFNRGKHGAQLFPDVEKLRGDRRADLSALEHGRWDAVVDTSGAHPRDVTPSTRALANRVEHYTFVSTVAVYRDFPRQAGLDESAPLATLEQPASDDVSGANSGPLKAACESVVEAEFRDRALIVRPGFIVGPHDPTGRFAYWLARVVEGGEVLAPGDPDAPVQVIDVRDLARWTVEQIERRATGAFNAAGREHVLSMSELLDVCRRECGDCRFTWVDDAFLIAHDVVPRRDLPLWSGDAVGAALIDTTKARAAGLWCQDIRATVRDTFGWLMSSDSSRRASPWLSRDRERELLLRFREAQPSLAASP